MRIWQILVAVGALSLGSGWALLLGGHHTLGLAGSALAGVLLVTGVALGVFQVKLRGNLPSPTKDVSGSGSVQPSRRSVRNSIIAVIVVVLVGAGTFFAATYFASSGQGGGSVSTISTQSISPGGSSVTYQSTTGGEGSTGEQTSGGSTTMVTRTFTLITTASSESSETVTSTSSVTGESSTGSSTQSWQFSLAYSPSVTVANNDVHLNASYINSLNSSVLVHEKITLFQGTTGFPEGSVSTAVIPHGQLSLDYDLGVLSAGNYSVVFYVVDNDTGAQISQSVTLSFSV